MLGRDGTVPPDIDLGVDLLVQVRDRGWAHTGTPQRLCNVLYAPDGHSGQLHLDKQFLDRRLSAPLALNNSRLKDLLA